MGDFDSKLQIDLERLWELFPGATYIRWWDGLLQIIDGCYCWCDASFSKESGEYLVIASVLALWRKERRGNFYVRVGRKNNRRDS